MKKLIFFAVCSVFLSSCAHHFYNVENYNISETQVVLNNANFRVVGLVEGRAQATYIFGIGGLSKSSLKGNALADMYRNADLKGSQTIINVSFKSRILAAVPPIYQQFEYKASGVIIEFMDASIGNTGEEITLPLQEETPKQEIPMEAVSEISAKPEVKKGKEMVEYNGVSAVVVKKEGDEVVLVAELEQIGTWEEAKQFCESLGGSWKMPSVEDLNAIKKELGDIMGNKGCWTIEQVNQEKAKVYFAEYLFPTTNSLKKHKNTILSVARVDVKDVVSK